MFKNSARSLSLRTDLIKYFMSFLMSDDERAEMHGLPEGCRMRENAKIYSPENLECGEYVWIGENAKLDASGGLSIGSHTSIGLNVCIWSHTSMLTNVLMENASGSPLIRRKKTQIGSGCFIGGPSVVYSGVTMGDCTVVLPMSTVTSDTKGFEIVGGSPARTIREVTPDYIAKELAQADIDDARRKALMDDFVRRYEAR
ncbi:acyltransferase [Lacibacterium aquatile]|uniref:Acyltransferase n=1 Tax=Lacibacterium aquatile TaxID=1168082 RepID=A0ABW5DXM9_9PROT